MRKVVCLLNSVVLSLVNTSASCGNRLGIQKINYKPSPEVKGHSIKDVILPKSDANISEIVNTPSIDKMNPWACMEDSMQ